MFVLDTNVVSELRKAKSAKADPRLVAWAQRLLPGQLFISAITVLELETGRVVGRVAVDLPFPREATDPAVVELRRRILARLVGEPQSEPRRKP